MQATLPYLCWMQIMSFLHNSNHFVLLLKHSCLFIRLQTSTVQQTLMMLQEIQRQGANYQCISFIQLGSLVLFRFIEAYLSLLSESRSHSSLTTMISGFWIYLDRLTLCPFIIIWNLSRFCPFKVLSVSFWLNAAVPISVNWGWGCRRHKCAIHATLYRKPRVQRRSGCFASIPVWFFFFFLLPLVHS